MQYVITPKNFDKVLKCIKRNFNEKMFDFSGTDFAVLGSKKIMQIFSALSNRSQTFSLKLNDCVFIVANTLEDTPHMSAVTLGLSTTKLIDVLELKRCVITLDGLKGIAGSLVRNHSINNIHVDGFRNRPDSGIKVIPSQVRDLLRNHITAMHVFIDGLDALRKRLFMFVGKKAAKPSNDNKQMNKSKLPNRNR